MLLDNFKYFRTDWIQKNHPQHIDDIDDMDETDDIISIDDILCDINQKKGNRSGGSFSDPFQDAYHLDTATVMNMELRNLSKTDVWKE